MVVKEIVKGGSAARSGAVAVGDVIIRVENTSAIV
jgi:C-terminal processing protease CtpA/Prc